MITNLIYLTTTSHIDYSTEMPPHAIRNIPQRRILIIRRRPIGPPVTKNSPTPRPGRPVIAACEQRSLTRQWVLDTESPIDSFLTLDGSYNSTAYPPSTATQDSFQAPPKSELPPKDMPLSFDSCAKRLIFDKWISTVRERKLSRQQCQSRQPSLASAGLIPNASNVDRPQDQESQTTPNMQMVHNGEIPGFQFPNSEDHHQEQSPMNTLRAMEILNRTIKRLEDRQALRERQHQPTVQHDPRTPSPAAISLKLDHGNHPHLGQAFVSLSSSSAPAAAHDNKISPFDDTIQMTERKERPAEDLPPPADDNSENKSDSSFWINGFGERMPSTRKTFAPMMAKCLSTNRVIKDDISEYTDIVGLTASTESNPQVKPNSTWSRLLANKINPRKNLSGFLAAILGHSIPRVESNDNDIAIDNANTNDNGDNDAASVSSTSSTSSVSSIISKVSSIAGSIKRFIFG